MKRFWSYRKSFRLLGVAAVPIGVVVLLILLTIANLYQINARLEQIQRSVRWRLVLNEVDHARLMQGLLMRRGILYPANAPGVQEVDAAHAAWNTSIKRLRSLTDDRAEIDTLAALPPAARMAFTSAYFQTYGPVRDNLENQAFVYNQATDRLIEDQTFHAESILRQQQAEMTYLATRYTVIALIGLSLLALVGLWVLLWASRLPRPLLDIRMALAAAASDHYDARTLKHVVARSDIFGELALAVHEASEAMHAEEQALQVEANELHQQVEKLWRVRINRSLTSQEPDDEDQPT